MLKDVHAAKVADRESSASLHSTKMMELTKAKFSLSHEVNELEKVNQKLKDQLAQLEQEEQRLEEEYNKENDVLPDETTLKLQIAKSMGIELIANQGVYDKARISECFFSYLEMLGFPG